jgi:MFS family permease
MKEKISNFLYGLVGLGLFILPIVAFILLIVGGAKLFESLYPILEKISILVWSIVWLLVIISFVPGVRKFTGSGIILGTYIGAAILWFLCFYITYSLWGILGILIGVIFLGLGVYFTAILALLFNGQFLQAFSIVFNLAQILFLRWLGFLIITKHKPAEEEIISEGEQLPERYVAIQAQKFYKKPLSLGVVFLSIFLFISGSLELFEFFQNQFFNLRVVWGILAIVSGVGLILQKYWAYKITQGLMVINIITAPFFFFLPQLRSEIGVIIVVIWMGISGMILWYLSRKSTKEQFLEAMVRDSISVHDNFTVSTYEENANIENLKKESIKCPICNYENNPTNNFCTNCGAKLTKNELS